MCRIHGLIEGPDRVTLGDRPEYRPGRRGVSRSQRMTRAAGYDVLTERIARKL